MQTSFILFATDLVDEGFDQVAEAARERAGVDALTMACTYHHSRDVLPHNPRHKVRFMDGGVFFRPDPTRYEGLKLQPKVAHVAVDQDPLALLVAAAERKGLAVRGWTNNLHSTLMGSQYPDCAVQNAFGDVYITSLCPANPDVRRYVTALTGDLGRYPLAGLLAESVCYMPFDHGYHHERTLVPILPTVKYLLGLCFCAHCRQAAIGRGVDITRLHAFIRKELELALNGEPTVLDGMELEPTMVGQLVGGEMQGFLETREAVVATLVEEMADALGDIPLEFMEWSGGLRAVGAGMRGGATGGTAVARTWQDGVCITAVAKACHGLCLLGYVREPERLRAELDAYRAALPSGAAISVALRPMPPDCESAGQLMAKLRIVEEVGAKWVEFYHFGFMRLVNLDWIGQALAALRRR